MIVVYIYKIVKEFQTKSFQLVMTITLYKVLFLEKWS